MKPHRIYVVGIFEQNTWTRCNRNTDDPATNHLNYCSFLREECEHTHTTVSGAARCLRRLSKTWADGSHNGWAHFGQVVPLQPCGHPDHLTEDEEQKLAVIETDCAKTLGGME